MHWKNSSREFQELCVAANFVEVFLAGEGHRNPVGINYLEKLQIPHLPSIYGAMLAGVEYVLMGAGIPVRIPGVLDRFVTHEPATYPFQVTGAQEGDDNTLTFVPREFIDQEFMERDLPPLSRPQFLAIIASNVLAVTMVKKANGRVDGFIVEGPTAGGHNAPPRGKLQLNDAGEPIYGDRDQVDLEKIRELGLPFWLAGGYGSPDRLREALDAGAAGIQVGSAFALCEESGIDPTIKRDTIDRALAGTLKVRTDPRASPSGYPFKVVTLDNSLSDLETYVSRQRVCDLGFLRTAYLCDDDKIGYRCPAEPEDDFVDKGGMVDDTKGRK